jgi:hypothetical protein
MPGGRDIRAGGAFVELGLRSTLQKGLNRASKQLRAFSGAAASLGAKFGTIGAAITGPLLGASKAFADAGDKLHKMSARTGVSAQSLSELEHAANLSGASVDQLGSALFRMRRRIANAATETGPAVRALKELGLSAKDLDRLSPEDQFAVLSDALSGMENQSRAAQLGFEILGDGFKGLSPLIAEGSDGIAKMRKEARDLGVTMSDADAQSAADLTDGMFRLGQQFKFAALQAGAALAPMLTDLIGKFTDIGSKVVGWIKENKGLIAIVFKVGAAIGAAGAALGVIAGVSAAASVALAGLSAIVGAILSPIGILIGAVGSLGYAILFHTDTGAAALDWLGKHFQRLMDFVGPIVQGIKDALSAGDMALAADVAWLGIKVAFQHGKNLVLGVWREFTTGLMQFFDDAAQHIIAGWRKLNTTIAEQLIKLGGKLGLLGNLSTESVIATLRQDAAMAGQAAKGRADDRRLARGASLTRAPATDRKALEDLQAKLAGKVVQAQVAAADAALERQKGIAPPPGPKFDVPGVTATGTGGGAIGTFSALAAGMLGRSGPAERTAKATEAMVDELEELNDKADEGLVFG